jgi:RNA polymerase sigma-70 factor (ECF subfamily)
VQDRLEDQELLARARLGDVSAFDALVERYRGKVYGLALRMMQDPQDAEEMLQETFLSAWQSLAAFRGDSALGSWLHRICANFCLMRLRQRRSSKEVGHDPLPGPDFSHDGLLLTPPSYDWSRGTEEHVLNNELRGAIEEATARLPDGHRTTFLLRDVEGLSYEEIAEVMGTTVPSVKSRLHRARLALREAIDGYYARPGVPLVGRSGGS